MKAYFETGCAAHKMAILVYFVLAFCFYRPGVVP